MEKAAHVNYNLNVPNDAALHDNNTFKNNIVNDYSCKTALILGERSLEPSFTPSLANHSLLSLLWEGTFKIYRKYAKIYQNMPKNTEIFKNYALKYSKIVNLPKYTNNFPH